MKLEDPPRSSFGILRPPIFHPKKIEGPPISPPPPLQLKLWLVPYRVFSHDVMAAILVSQTSPVGVELFSYANVFFCSNKFAQMLATRVTTLYTLQGRKLITKKRKWCNVLVKKIAVSFLCPQLFLLVNVFLISTVCEYYNFLSIIYFC